MMALSKQSKSTAVGSQLGCSGILKNWSLTALRTRYSRRLSAPLRHPASLRLRPNSQASATRLQAALHSGHDGALREVEETEILATAVVGQVLAGVEGVGTAKELGATGDPWQDRIGVVPGRIDNQGSNVFGAKLIGDALGLGERLIAK